MPKILQDILSKHLGHGHESPQGPEGDGAFRSLADGGDFSQQMTEEHNKHRQMHGAPPLQNDEQARLAAVEGR